MARLVFQSSNGGRVDYSEKRRTSKQTFHYKRVTGGNPFFLFLQSLGMSAGRRLRVVF